MLQNSNNPDYIALPRKVSQQVLRQLDNNWKSFFQSIKEWKKTPNKFKKRPSLLQNGIHTSRCSLLDLEPIEHR
jgi:putative transposase